jgi:hypothetical protein
MLKNKDWIKTFDETNSKGNIRKKTAKGMMFISTPQEIEELIKKVPKGKLTTTKMIAEKLTKKHKVDFTCPLTTGIFSSIVANKSEQELEMGKTEVAPYWRVVKDKGYLYDKYLGTPSKQSAYLKKEGFSIVPSGTKKGPMIKDIGKYLV